MPAPPATAASAPTRVQRAPLRPVAVAGLTVGRADDPAEHRADVVADRALARLRRVHASADGRALEPHRHSAACGHLRRTVTATRTPAPVVGAAGGALDAATSERIERQIGSGTPLPAAVRGRMETAFGTSLGHVRVHDGAGAARDTAAVSARAFTVGNDIFLGAGQGTADPEGERVLAHEIAHVVTDGPRAQVQRVHITMETYKSLHKEENQRFLLDCGIPVTTEDYDQAVTAAILLDHDYDSRAVLAASLDDIEDQVPLLFPGLDGDLVANQIPYWIKKDPAFLGSYLREYIRRHTGIDRTDIEWGPVDKLGRGTWVKADYFGTHAEGSDAGGWNPWASALFRRGDAKSSFYVRGHLLNRHLGGPGLDYNLVPLTSRATDFGGNDANAAHSKMFEEVVKHKYALLDTVGEEAVDELVYEVTADNTARRRGATAVALRISDKVLEALNGFVTGSIGLDDSQVDQHFGAMYSATPWPATEPAPSAAQKRSIVAASVSRTWSGRPLGATVEGQRLLSTLDREGLMRWVTLVCADRGSPGATSLDELKERVVGNRSLWELEDAWVPTSITVYARWRQHGEKEEFGPAKIIVQKPDALYSPYWHARDSFIAANQEPF